MMGIRTIKVRVRFIAEPDDGGFHVYCPELKGLHVGGATEEEAFLNARHAAEAYLLSLITHNLLQAELDAATRDAERYRWLRVNSTQPTETWSTHSNPESLDREVDAAIERAKGWKVPE